MLKKKGLGVVFPLQILKAVLCPSCITLMHLKFYAVFAHHLLFIMLGGGVIANTF